MKQSLKEESLRYIDDETGFLSFNRLLPKEQMSLDLVDLGLEGGGGLLLPGSDLETEGPHSNPIESSKESETEACTMALSIKILIKTEKN
jgi:hypothetical protein